MRRCLCSQLWALFHVWWLPLLPLALGLLLGCEAAAALAAYARRSGTLDARSTLAFLLDVRHFVPLAGAAWAATFLGMEFDGRGAAALLSRGCSRFQIFGSKLFLCFLGCAVISLAAQLAAVFSSFSLWQSLPAPFLLRCFGLRLLLDLGMMAPCAAIAVFSGSNLYGRALAGVYGLLLWRCMGSHYALWLPGPGKADPLACWPLAALPLSIAAYWLALRRKEF